jgi:hypothetical protein
LLPPRLAGGINGSTCAHSSSVRSLGYRKRDVAGAYAVGEIEAMKALRAALEPFREPPYLVALSQLVASPLV